MSKLEEIKEKAIVEKAHFKNIKTGESGWTKIVTLSEEHFNYLIQQSKRVEELKEDLKYERQALINQERASDAEIERLEKCVEDLKKENDRYKQALEKY